MSVVFDKILPVCDNETNFHFEQVFYGNDLWYHITFDNLENKKRETFRMYRDENGQWKIAAQVLPNCVHESELIFNDAIEDNL